MYRRVDVLGYGGLCSPRHSLLSFSRSELRYPQPALCNSAGLCRLRYVATGLAVRVSFSCLIRGLTVFAWGLVVYFSCADGGFAFGLQPLISIAAADVLDSVVVVGGGHSVCLMVVCCDVALGGSCAC